MARKQNKQAEENVKLVQEQYEEERTPATIEAERTGAEGYTGKNPEQVSASFTSEPMRLTSIQRSQMPEEQQPCECVSSHRPRVHRTERHFIFPRAQQMELFGRIADSRIVYLCASGHTEVHFYLEELLAGREVSGNFNDFLRELALHAHELITTVREAELDTPEKRDEYAQTIIAKFGEPTI